MPCFTTTTMNANMKGWDAARVAAAIKAAKAEGFFQNGALTLQASSKEELDRWTAGVTQQYAKLTLQAAAKRFGWTASAEKKTDTGLVQFNLNRR